MVLFGSSSGAVTSIDPGELMSRGSLFLTRPTLRHYVSTPAELREASADLFDLVSSGAIGLNVGQRFPLRQAAEAHRALEARATIGSTVLIP